MPITRELILRLSEGDEQAFHCIFKANYAKVKAFALGLLKSEDDAEDIAQTVFLKLWSMRRKLSDLRSLDAYLYTMTRNMVLNFMATYHAAMISLEQVSVSKSSSESPHDDLTARDLQLLVDMVVGEMPEQRQKVYRLSRENGLTNDEISSRLGITKKTVENHLNIALRQIRKVVTLFYLLLIGWVY